MAGMAAETATMNAYKDEYESQYFLLLKQALEAKEKHIYMKTDIRQALVIYHNDMLYFNATPGIRLLAPFSQTLRLVMQSWQPVIYYCLYFSIRKAFLLSPYCQ